MRSSLCLLLLSALLLVANCGDLKGEQLADAASKQALCNDGTAPVYYKHLVEGSSEYLIYLEGGGGCFNETACELRYQQDPQLMTASYDVIPREVTMQGVLSLDCDVNPHFCKSNIFFVHYCSSDVYAGQREYPYKDITVHFNGKRIVEEVVKQIVSLYPQISEATRIVLGGDSAGSIGTQVNGDRIGDLLAQLIPNGSYDYRLLADSGWFLPGLSLRDNPCSDTYCNLEYTTRLQIPFQNIQMSETCLANYQPDEQWQCMFLPFSLSVPSIKTPTFFAFHKHDAYQAGADGIPTANPTQFTPLEQRWTMLRASQTEFALYMLRDLDTKHGLFVPDCVYHVLTLEDEQISDLKVNGASFNDAYGQWLEGKVAVYLEEDCGDKIACNPNCPGVYGQASK